MTFYVVTYQAPGKRPLKLTRREVLHSTQDCRHLRPRAGRPYIGSTVATSAEVATHRRCRDC